MPDQPTHPPDATSPGRLPDFIVAGHSKSGTTALYEMLAHHPQIFVGRKEPRFFATELYERDIPRTPPTPMTLDAYKAWFRKAQPEQVVGDISPDYLWSEFAPGLIAETVPEAKIIVILREPASFLVSLHRQWLQVSVESETDLEKALALEQPRREGRKIPADTYWPRGLLYSEHARYVEQLKRFKAFVAPERMLVLIYEEYNRDNEATVRKVLRFLEVDDDIEISRPESNPTVEVRSPRLNGLLRKLTVGQGPVSGAIKRTILTLTPWSLRQKTLNATRRKLVFGEPTPPDERFLLELRRRFEPEVRELSEYLGRDLVSLWGYDKLDG